MENLLFAIAQLAVIVTFAAFISDFRHKQGMTPLVNEKFIKIMKLSYLVPLSIYVYVLANLFYLSVLDLVALVTTASGTLLAVKAKLDLGKCHSWTGYCIESSRLNTLGIYKYIRHPLYTGIFIFAIGGLITVVPHSPWYLSLTVILSLIYIISFLAILSIKETKLLSKELGSSFQNYTKQVHPFLPLRKYTAK